MAAPALDFQVSHALMERSMYSITSASTILPPDVGTNTNIRRMFQILQVCSYFIRVRYIIQHTYTPTLYLSLRVPLDRCRADSLSHMPGTTSQLYVDYARGETINKQRLADDLPGGHAVRTVVAAILTYLTGSRRVVHVQYGVRYRVPA